MLSDRLRRRDFIPLLAGAVAAGPAGGRAEQVALLRIGVLFVGLSPESKAAQHFRRLSLPSRGADRNSFIGCSSAGNLVAPHPGAWIETGTPYMCCHVPSLVAPATRAWIETSPKRLPA